MDVRCVHVTWAEIHNSLTVTFFRIQIFFLQLMSREQAVHDVAYFVITGIWGGSGGGVEPELIELIKAHLVQMKFLSLDTFALMNCIGHWYVFRDLHNINHIPKKKFHIFKRYIIDCKNCPFLYSMHENSITGKIENRTSKNNMQAFLSLCWITRKQKHACFSSKRRKYLQTYVCGGGTWK